VYKAIGRVASQDVTVLILGESGTGKELVARAIYHYSKRADKPFLAINCAAIPENLLESELFGHEKGAFTGADRRRIGKFEQASGGTLFLDEIAELSPTLQAKLLRVIQEGEVRPLGASRAERVDVRVVAATNKDLEARLKSGAFREDLYYRLNVIHIHLPPLRERAEDLLALCDHFLSACSARAGKEVRGLHEAAKKALLSHTWPGNVRELENTIERAVALCETGVIRAEDLPAAVRERRAGETDTLQAALARGQTLAELERDYIQRVLTAEGGNKTRAAQRLGLDRKTLYRKLEEYAAEGAGGAAEIKDDDDSTEKNQ
jgi:transcriptional regulator with PAS, ATPase and Fis domain